MTFYIGREWAKSPLIDRPRQHQIIRAAVDRAYTAFEQNHQQWPHSLFDKHFVMQIITPWLTISKTTDKALTPYVFAAVWAAQLSTQQGQQEALLAQCLPVAVEFLRLLQKELPAVPTILPILVQNHLDGEMVADSNVPAQSQGRHYV